eukprot:scaffold6166_cov85-Skeletonema_dohrnii-CCMP3373.AAC.3
MDGMALMRALFEIFDQPTNHVMHWIRASVFREGDRQGGRAVFIVVVVLDGSHPQSTHHVHR